jgi:hypothetical protein
MSEQKKIAVPPRAERIQEMGKPKSPRMGAIAPKTIAVPEVGKLVDQMAKVAEDILLDRFLEEKQNPPCCINCKCPPCRRGDCGNCFVSAARDTKAVKDYASMYRGVIYDK